MRLAISTSIRRNVWASLTPPLPVKKRTIYTYGVAAAYSAKGRPFDPRINVYEFRPPVQISPQGLDPRIAIRNRRRRFHSGEDAFFISNIGQEEDQGIALGIADGVGGYALSGIDPADFSHGLCEFMERCAVRGTHGESSVSLKPSNVLEFGFNDLLERGKLSGGGSTACVGVADRKGHLEVAKSVINLLAFFTVLKKLIHGSLGDSGFMVLRSNAINYLSQPQTHAFNTPYQLAFVPPWVRKYYRRYGGGGLGDLPKQASISRQQLNHGDVLVFATDGVWDNLTAQAILRIVSDTMMRLKAWKNTALGISVGGMLRSLATESSPSLQSSLASSIVASAKSASTSRTRDGPFAREAKKNFPAEHFNGGKVDDICVVVAAVIDGTAAQ
ncbi:MAG: hypothetical protein M1825_002343 [Sarcosagium campestre]|nr:MAG: hypothetical protein M1825_002343 [Sarcosagium campestre]